MPLTIESRNSWRVLLPTSTGQVRQIGSDSFGQFSDLSPSFCGNFDAIVAALSLAASLDFAWHATLVLVAILPSKSLAHSSSRLSACLPVCLPSERFLNKQLRPPPGENRTVYYFPLYCIGRSKVQRALAVSYRLYIV